MPDNVYKLFFQPGEVSEIRAIGLRGKGPWQGHAFGAAGIVSGYFNNPDDFKKAALALDKAGATGVYFTINPCNEALMGRSANRLIASPKRTTADAEIDCLRWLPVDLDPVRPAGISATDDELNAAIELARGVAEWMEGEMGLSRGIRGASGNGYHILYRLPDLPNTRENVGLIRSALLAIQHQFSSNGNREVDIDVSVFNPARIWKVYGTTARKGDSIPSRPHRKSFLLKNNPKTLEEVPICQL